MKKLPYRDTVTLIEQEFEASVLEDDAPKSSGPKIVLTDENGMSVATAITQKTISYTDPHGVYYTNGTSSYLHNFSAYGEYVSRHGDKWLRLGCNAGLKYRDRKPFRLCSLLLGKHRS